MSYQTKKAQKGWTVRITSDVDISGMPPKYVKMAIVLERFSKTNRGCFPSNARLAKAYGGSISTAREIIRHMERDGYLRRRHKKAGNGVTRTGIVLLKRLDDDLPAASPRRPTEEAMTRIEELRAMPYSEYLEQPEWQKTRLRAIERDGSICRACGSSERLNVHHVTYERTGEERPEDLTTLCRDCHELFHRNANASREHQPDDAYGAMAMWV